MNDLLTLKSKEILNIKENKTIYYGGSQNWYSERWQQQSGCGPTSFANILWYLSRTRKKYAAICDFDASNKAGFIRLMNKAWSYVTPSNLGVNSPEMFANGVKLYCKQESFSLNINTLSIAPIYCRKSTYADAYSFIVNSLNNDAPIAFLNLSNGSLNNLESWHWVTIVALEHNNALIYDQGYAKWINFEQWFNSSLLGGGFVSVK